jgi:hypothetical protein
MNRIVSLLAVGVVLATSSVALAGEPTGRYQGAVGSVPEGVEQVYVQSSSGQRGVSAAFAENIPAAQSTDHAFALLQNHGRGYTVTAFSTTNDVGNDVRLASSK